MRADWVLCPACGFDFRTGAGRSRLAEAPPTSYEGYWEAWWAARALRKRLPRARSAYKPSGRLPRRALALMMAGAALGAVAGAVAAFTIAFAFWLVGLVLALWLARLGGAGAAEELLGFFVFSGGVVGYAALGGLAAVIVAGIGKRVGNRSVRAVLLLSFAAVVVAVLLMAAFSLAALVEAGQALPKPALGGVLFVATVSLAPAWLVAARMTKAAKFCELCLQRMESQELPYLSLGGAIALVRAIAPKPTHSEIELDAGFPLVAHDRRAPGGPSLSVGDQLAVHVRAQAVKVFPRPS